MKSFKEIIWTVTATLACIAASHCVVIFVIANMQGHPLYGAAVLIVRNPLNALVAEWKRQKTVHTHAQPHVADLGREYFGRFTALT